MKCKFFPDDIYESFGVPGAFPLIPAPGIGGTLDYCHNLW